MEFLVTIQEAVDIKDLAGGNKIYFHKGIRYTALQIGEETYRLRNSYGDKIHLSANESIVLKINDMRAGPRTIKKLYDLGLHIGMVFVDRHDLSISELIEIRICSNYMSYIFREVESGQVWKRRSRDYWPSSFTLGYYSKYMNRKAMIRHLIQTYKTLPIEEAMKNLTFGFELETQSTNGATYDYCSPAITGRSSETEFSDSKLFEVLQLDEYSPTYRLLYEFHSCALHAVNFSSLNPKLSAIFKVRGSQSFVDIVMNVLEIDTWDKFVDLLEDSYEIIRDAIIKNRRIDVESYTHFEDYSQEEIFPNLNHLIEVTYDESVSGFEFRTTKGHSIEEINNLCDNLFSADHKHDVDINCSFHIHLKLGDIKHKFSRASQRQMAYYLITNMDRVPERVKLRWQDEGARHFFSPGGHEDKYSFVHFHSRNRTLEFRCFGNINTAEDARICFQLAAEALQYAYNNTGSDLSDHLWNEAAHDALNFLEGKRLQKIDDIIQTIQTVRKDFRKMTRDYINTELGAVELPDSFTTDFIISEMLRGEEGEEIEMVPHTIQNFYGAVRL